MGLGGISIWQLLIIFGIVLLLFGGKRLRSLGSDLGTAIKGFRSSSQGRQGRDGGLGPHRADRVGNRDRR